jgi:hypothetical protein
MKTHLPRAKRPLPDPVPAKVELPPFELTEQSFRLGDGEERDDLREELGEAFVQTITSGQQAAEDIRDQTVTEESGGPFVITTGAVEFAQGTDGSNPADAEPAPFPVVSAQPARRKRVRR